MDLYIVSVAVFVGILALLIFRNRDEIEVQNYIMFIRRTDKGRNLISKISSLNERFWSKLGNVSTLIGFGGMGFALFFLGRILFKQLMGVPTAGGPRLVVPVPSQKAAFMPGVIGVPFWSWIISVGLLMVVHEGMHGVMLKTVKSKIESLGVLLLAVIPGAFVEPDEEDLKEKNWKNQLKVYSAGSFANFCLAGLIFLITTFIFFPAFTTSAVGFRGYVNASNYDVREFPAEGANLTSPILSIDGERTKNIEDLARILKDKRPDEKIRIQTLEKNYSITLASDPENRTQAFMGIAGIGQIRILRRNYRTSSIAPGLKFLQSLLGWIFLLNLGIGIMNLLPLKPLDGGLMVESLAERFYPEKSKKIVRSVSAISLFVLLSVFLMIFLG